MHDSAPPAEWFAISNAQLRDENKDEIIEGQAKGSFWKAVHLLYQADLVLAEATDTSVQVAKVLHEAAEQILNIEQTENIAGAFTENEIQESILLPRFNSKTQLRLSLEGKYSDIRLCKGNGEPNPELYDLNAVTLRRYHEHEILNNRYKSYRWSCVYLLLTADIVGSNSQYNTRRSLSQGFQALAIKILETIDHQAIRQGETPGDIRDQDRAVEKTIRLIVDHFLVDQGLRPKNGKRPKLKTKDLDALFEQMQFVIEWEITEGYLLKVGSRAELCRRVASHTGLAYNTINKYAQDWEARKSQVSLLDEALIAQNDKNAEREREAQSKIIEEDE